MKTDLIVELRRLYEAAPQGEWTLKPFVDLRGRVIGYDIQQIGPNGGDVIEVAKREDADLIVAMHEALPALLRMVESLRLYVRHMEQDNPDDPDQWIYLMGRRWEAIVAALAKLKQGEVTHD